MQMHYLGGVLGAAFIAFSTGCLVMSGKSIDESGVRVTASTLGQVEPGRTTGAWLIATLGEPTARSSVAGLPGLEILRYDFERRTSEGGTVFLIFAGGKETSACDRTYFEVTDGVVTRYWKES
jgi:hypothetical protein